MSVPTTSPTELRAIQLIALGYDSDDLTEMLGIDSGRNLVMRLCRMFQVRNRVLLLTRAFELGLLEPPKSEAAEIARFANFSLTTREHDLLHLLANGHEQAEAAVKMRMAPATFNSHHQAKLYNRLELPDRVSFRTRRNYVVAHALWSGILDLELPLYGPDWPIERDRQIMSLVAAGANNLHMAEVLGVTRGTTVDGGIGILTTIHGCADRYDLIELALEKGWIGVPQNMWPHIAALLADPLSKEERDFLPELVMGRDTAVPAGLITWYDYRRLYGGLREKIGVKTKREIRAALSLERVLQTAPHLPLGIRFRTAPASLEWNEWTLVQALAAGASLESLQETQTDAADPLAGLLKRWEANTTSHLMARLHRYGLLPPPPPAGSARRHLLAAVVTPPTALARAVLTDLVAGVSMGEALIRQTAGSREFLAGLSAAGIATPTQGAAYHCWISDSWRGR